LEVGVILSTLDSWWNILARKPFFSPALLLVDWERLARVPRSVTLVLLADTLRDMGADDGGGMFMEGGVRVAAPGVCALEGRGRTEMSAAASTEDDT
jgi:hypothetical protein